MHYKGKVTNWNDDKGFGFVTPSLGGERVFLHISAFSRRARRPVDNDLVTYELGFDDRRRARANKVKFSTDATAPVPAPSWTSVAIRLAGVTLFFAFVGVATAIGKLPLAVAAIYGIASLIAYTMYWLDKRYAQRGKSRTPERTLHVIGVFGGWPGAWLAQRIFRHKSRKAEFQRVFWATVILNCGALGWLLTAKGSAFLNSL